METKKSKGRIENWGAAVLFFLAFIAVMAFLVNQAMLIM